MSIFPGFLRKVPQPASVSNPIHLNNLRVASPCPAKWSNIVTCKKSPFGTVILTVILSTNLAMAGNSSALTNLESQQTAQNDAELKLKVVDREGALIVTAQIALEKSAKEKIVGSADSAGEWSQTKLAPGKYTLTIEARGFQTFKSEIEIHNGMLMNLQVTLPWDVKQLRF